MVALDMDGTLLDSNSRVLPSSAAALRAALAAGVDGGAGDRKGAARCHGSALGGWPDR